MNGKKQHTDTILTGYVYYAMIYERKSRVEQNKPQEVIPINRKAKDTFFKTVYATEERQRELVSFLLGIEGEKITIVNVRPVLFGNKENDLAILGDELFYIMAENQATVSPNVPYRLLEYITAGLRSTVDSERLLYGRKRVYFPIPKLYMIQTGIEMLKRNLPENVQYDIRLSDSYLSVDEKYKGKAIQPDLDAVVHVYDFRMTREEILDYIERNILSDRFQPYKNDLRNYALTANGVTYMQRAAKDGKQEKYRMPENVAAVVEYLDLLIKRKIFVELLTDKEVCDMTMAQFSRDDMLIYQGREEGREEERAEAVIELLEEVGELPGALRQLIMRQKDIEVLRRWHRFAAKAQSIEEFEKAVGIYSIR